VKGASYVEAATTLGAGHLRILLRHILPNVFPVLIVTASVQIGAVILLESSLSFLGFGIPPPYPSWGRMLQEAQRFLRQ
jgi:peptide/nickel transport system permease protein